MRETDRQTERKKKKKVFSVRRPVASRRWRHECREKSPWQATNHVVAWETRMNVWRRPRERRGRHECWRECFVCCQLSGDSSNGVVGDMTVVVVVVVVDDSSRKADDMNVEWPPPTTKPPSSSPFFKKIYLRKFCQKEKLKSNFRKWCDFGGF
jgi:hypothetical protein